MWVGVRVRRLGSGLAVRLQHEDGVRARVRVSVRVSVRVRVRVRVRRA